MSNADWTRRSLAHVWHPCTQMQDHAGGADAAIPLVPIASAEGAWLTDHEGRRYLDAVSSWWTNIFGHRHPHIVARLKEQLDRLDHVLLAGFTHAPAVELAEKLVALAPKSANGPNLTRVTYADNGSSAVEVALKMSAHYWRNSGQPGKTKFICLANSYHGETLGALAVSGEGMYRDAYAPLMMQPIVVASPDCFHRAPGESWEDYTRRRFRDMEEALERHAHEVAAVIVEPLVQCAGGMRMYHAIYLRLLREACTRHGVHLIADEIAVGFGRTGRMFAHEWVEDRAIASTARGEPRRPATDGRAGGSDEAQGPARDGKKAIYSGCVPDMLCLSKGLTGGTMALAAVLTHEQVYEAFLGDYASQRAFLHSHSYTGNPIACTAALATLEVFAQDDWMARNQRSSALMWRFMSRLASHARVADVRQQGMILAVEMAKNPRKREPFPAAERRGLRVYRHGLENGVLLRPLGNVIYVMPPYVLSDEEIIRLCAVATDGIELATRD